ncbi:MAG TPA: DciA family protein [Roseiarcus sp.]|nr:DciA family protein [Roseiarcus sp.]
MADASSPTARKRKPYATPLGAHLGAIVSPALAARGLSEASLVAHWPEIVGQDVARFARFERLNWPPRGAKTDPAASRPPAILVLRIDGAFALEAQHLAHLIVERVNAHLGWACVAKLAFRQGPLPEMATRRRIAPPGAQALAEARAACQHEDEALREALVRLGARVIERARRGG